jgi:hypothetical protein
LVAGHPQTRHRQQTLQNPATSPKGGFPQSGLQPADIAQTIAPQGLSDLIDEAV